jgi:DNA/RNA endonuclease YhcR with UshA esterase domain
MKRFSTFILGFCIAVSANCQTKISLADISTHVGDSVTVTANIVSVKYFSSSSRPVTLLNAGAEFPNQLLTLVIYDELRNTLENTPEKMYSGKTVTASGKVVLYREKPQIVIYLKDQIVIVDKP